MVPDRRGRVRAGRLTLDLGARRAHLGDVLLELTALEFDLLAYLMAQPGQVFSRDQLLRAVWRSTAEWQQPATVTEHIRRLRTKIETEPHRPRILRTVRGAGYRLDIVDEHRADVDPSTRAAWGTLVHIDGRIVQADQVADAMFDLDDQTPLVGSHISELWLPASRSALREHIVTWPGPGGLTQLIAVERVDSTVTSVEFTSKHVEWHGTRAQHVTAAWRRTVRPEIARPSDGLGGHALMNEDTDYRALFERAADAVLVADDDGTYVDANSAAERMFGVPRHDLIGRRVTDFVEGEVAAIEHHGFTSVASHGERGRVRIRRGDGQLIVCDNHTTANFVPGRHLSIMRDVTGLVEE